MRIIEELKITCEARPSQWNGLVRDDVGAVQEIFVRYRWGILEIGIGDTESDAIASAMDGDFRGQCYIEKIGDCYDETLSTDGMLPYLKSFLKSLDEQDNRDENNQID